MKLPPKVIPRPYTNLAFQGHYYAELHDKGFEFSSRLLDAYYKDEKDIGKIDVLTEIAVEIGLNRDDFYNALESQTYAKVLDEIENDVLETVNPKTLPTIIIGDNIRIDGGLHTVEDLKQFLSNALATQVAVTISGTGCSETGCGFDGTGI